MFPSLLNCCTVDWFSKWPADALHSVANHFLHDVDVAPKVLRGLLDVCVDMQERVFDMTTKFQSELGRHYYVTPTSYLELINTFRSLIGAKRSEVDLRRRRYQNGFDKLVETEDQVRFIIHSIYDWVPKNAHA